MRLKRLVMLTEQTEEFSVLDLSAGVDTRDLNAAYLENRLGKNIITALAYRKAWLDGARNDQQPPEESKEDWFTWLLLAGRGAGKTRSGAEDCWWYAFRTSNCRSAIVAPTAGDVRKTCIEGESGLLARLPPCLLLNYNRQEMIITIRNMFGGESKIFGYSAEEPDRLRGPQHHRAWCDELAAWRYLDDTLDNLLMGLRLGKMPRIVATTTPRPIKAIKELVRDPTTRTSRGSTMKNALNLPKLFLQKILAKYAGTRTGRQELEAEILEDMPGALWERKQIDLLRCRKDLETGVITLPNGGKLPEMAVITVNVDPAVTSGEDADETGITVTGKDAFGHGYVLEDLSLKGTPQEWGCESVRAFDRWSANRIVYESNQGGEMVMHTLNSCARFLCDEGERNSDFVPTHGVFASRGKATRAEPVSALYAQGRVSHVGSFPKLEDQMCEFTSDFDKKKAGYSPDRMDSLVWGFTYLLVDTEATSGMQNYVNQEASIQRAQLRLAHTGVLPTSDLICMIAPPGARFTFGKSGTRYDVKKSMVQVLPSDVDSLEAIGFVRDKLE